jgi:hypothetical protein
MDRYELGGCEWALVEANRIRIETVRETEPGWSETLEETAAYLAQLGKTPVDYVEAWLAFRPLLNALRRSHGQSAPTVSGQWIARLRPREPDRVFSGAPSTNDNRWFVG